MTYLTAFLLSTTLMNSFSLSTYTELSNQYIYRGNNLNKNRLSPQIGFSLQHDSGWFIDAWLVQTEQRSLNIYSTATEHDIDWVSDISGGFQHQLSAEWRWAVSHAWIESYHDLSDINPDYQEWRGNLFYLNTVSLLLAYSDNYLQSSMAYWAGEFDFEYPLLPTWFGLIGYGHSDIGSADSIQYGWLGIQHNFSVYPLTDFASWKIRLHYSSSDNPPDYVDLCNRGCLEISFALYW